MSCLPSSNWSVLPPLTTETENTDTVGQLDAPITPSWKLSATPSPALHLFFYTPCGYDSPFLKKK